MTLFLNLLGDGQLAAAKATLYTVPSGRTAIIKCITYTNTDAVPRTVNLYLKTSTSRRIIPMNMSLAAGSRMDTGDEAYLLPAGATIEGDASAASVVDYTISGIERA
jgi:hypothetical protein